MSTTPTETTRLIGLLETALQALLVAQQGGRSSQPQADAPQPGKPLASWLDVYEGILAQRTYKPQTRKNQRANVAHVRRIWGATDVRALKPHHISKGLAEFLPDRSSTARRVLAALRDAYTEAVANDWADTNPALHVKPPVHKIIRKRLKFETWQQMRALAKASRQSWLEALLLLSLATGQRRADLAKMRFDDIVDGHLRIEHQKQAGKGYGARIELPLTLRLDAIGMTLADVVQHCRTCGAPGPTLLRKANGGSIEDSSLSTRFNECIRAVCQANAYAEKQWPSLHEVRSLAARLYKAQGLDTQTLLGHKHAEVTAIYEDDRGLSAKEWKRLPVAAALTALTATACAAS